jgi:hypothetical protein
MNSAEQWKNVDLFRPNRLSKEIVFADGIGSSGKGMLSHILASFERVEKQSNHSVFDYAATLHWLGKLETNGAIAYLQTEADADLYHLMMSRDVNFRPKDSTGVMQNPFRWKYFARLFMPEGDSVVERIKKQVPILNEAPHDALRSANLFFSAFGNDLKIVYILRDPFELILDWNRRGFGERIGRDPREFQFAYRDGVGIRPLFMMGSNLEYDKMCNMDRVINMIHFCLSQNMSGYEGLDPNHKRNVLFITFDDLMSRTEEVVDQIAEFTGTKTTAKTKKLLKKERLPRRLSNKKLLYDEIIQFSTDETNLLLDECQSMHVKFLALVKDKQP